MTVRVIVLRVNDPHNTGSVKLKQDVIIADATAKAMLTLWEVDINMVKEAKSYQMNKLVVRSFLGKQHLSFPPIGSTIEDIDDLQNVVNEDTTPSDEEQQLAAVKVTGIQQIESMYTCINYIKTIYSSRSRIIVCDTCNTT